MSGWSVWNHLTRPFHFTKSPSLTTLLRTPYKIIMQAITVLVLSTLAFANAGVLTTSVVSAPVVHTVAAPVVHSVPVVQRTVVAAPVVHSVPVVQRTVVAAPVVHSVPVVQKTVVAAPVLHTGPLYKSVVPVHTAYASTYSYRAPPAKIVHTVPVVQKTLVATPVVHKTVVAAPAVAVAHASPILVH